MRSLSKSLKEGMSPIGVLDGGDGFRSAIEGLLRGVRWK